MTQYQPKQFVHDFASIDLIIGPMYGGKTTELLRRLTVCKEMGLRCCYVNSAHDSRTSSAFSTHNKLISTDGVKSTGNIFGDSKDFIAAIKVDDVAELLSLVDQYDVFGIDEAQLFTNLLATSTDLVDIHNKRIIVAGLNGTSERRMFGEILYLIPHANSIQKLEPFCKLCADNGKIIPAIFTKCIIDKSDDIMIGGKDMYVAVCRNCYNKQESSDYCNPNTTSRYQQISNSSGGSDDSGDPGEPSGSVGSSDEPDPPYVPDTPDTPYGSDAGSDTSTGSSDGTGVFKTLLRPIAPVLHASPLPPPPSSSD